MARLTIATGQPSERAVYEHPYAVRLSHWAGAIAVFIMIASGLQVFMAFPSFGSKLPENDLVQLPAFLGLGGWLGGALQWHFTFAWLFLAAGALYLIAQAVSGNYRQVLFARRDVSGVWPMVRRYFLFGPKPPPLEAYNPLQKLAYTVTILGGIVLGITGLALYKPVQWGAVVALLGGFRTVRILHFGAMCLFLGFLPGHLVMVALHGWRNFASMWTGWKRDPEYR